MATDAGNKDPGLTTTSSGSEAIAPGLAESNVTLFSVAWCRDEPERIGEIAVLPSGASSVVLGRGATDDEPRMIFFRPFPGRLEATQPLGLRRLSRRQLEIQVGPTGIEVKNVGRCPLRINGVERSGGPISPGDTLSFKQELLLLCLKRPACPAPLRQYKPTPDDVSGHVDSFGILGESPAAWRLRDELAFAAKSGQHVLFVGESGTGKELAARAVHRMSTRAGQPLVARNAATFPAGLMDAELFGNLKNYPNPGMGDRPGLVGQADGGFLFLDEIGELPTELQTHLLRVLDSGGEYQRLGESVRRRSDFRLLAATNRDPEELRHDFLARLTVRIELPPLAERREDIPLLLRHLVGLAAEASPELASRFVESEEGKPIGARIDSKLVDAALHADFPGNVRDLDALLWKAMSASAGSDTILMGDGLFPSTTSSERSRSIRQGESSAPIKNREPSEGEIRDALRHNSGNVTRAAKSLGLSSRYALYRILVKLGIDVAENR
jgi:two-component system nitrogen regulation response regulator GlnG/two-component system response regulator HydG